jgi:UDP-N-acetylglucosamine---dolichyl-phosphate N-acetylglucosaminyltransferase
MVAWSFCEGIYGIVCLMKIVILIPAYNEASEISGVLRDVCSVVKDYRAEVLVVNDGSTDSTARRVTLLQREFSEISLISHMINCGVGAAFQTGFMWAKQRGADVVVTFDGDGQHRASDLEKMIDASLLGKADIINGSRFLRGGRIFNFQFSIFNDDGIPLSRRLGNFLANIITWMLSGIWLSDSQTGMRAFTRYALDQLDLHASGYEVCSEVVREASWYSLKIHEVPISVLYTQYSMSKGQGFSVGISTVMKLIVRSLMR